MKPKEHKGNTNKLRQRNTMQTQANEGKGGPKKNTNK